LTQSLAILEDAFEKCAEVCTIEIVDGFHRKIDLEELRPTFPELVPKFVNCKVFNHLNDVQYMIVSRRCNRISHTVAKTTTFDNVLYVDFLIDELKAKNPTVKKISEAQVRRFHQERFENEETDVKAGKSTFNEWYNVATVLSDTAKSLMREYTIETGGKFISRRLLNPLIAHCKNKLTEETRDMFQQRMIRFFYNFYVDNDKTLFPQTLVKTGITHFDMWTKVESNSEMRFGARANLPKSVKDVLLKKLDNCRLEIATIQTFKVQSEQLEVDLGRDHKFLPKELCKHLKEEVADSNEILKMDDDTDSEEEIGTKNAAVDEDVEIVHPEAEDPTNVTEVSYPPPKLDAEKIRALEQMLASDGDAPLESAASDEMKSERTEVSYFLSPETFERLSQIWIDDFSPANNDASEQQMVDIDHIAEWLTVVATPSEDFPAHVTQLAPDSVSFVYWNLEYEEVHTQRIAQVIVNLKSAMKAQCCVLIQCEPFHSSIVDEIVKGSCKDCNLVSDFPFNVAVYEWSADKRFTSSQTLTCTYNLYFKQSMPQPRQFGIQQNVLAPATEFVSQNSYPVHCNIISGLQVKDKKNAVYTNKVNSEPLIPFDHGTPLPFLQELVFRWSKSGSVLLDLSAHKTRIGECAFLNSLKYYGMVSNDTHVPIINDYLRPAFDLARQKGLLKSYGVPIVETPKESPFYTPVEIDLFTTSLSGMEVFPPYLRIQDHLRFTMERHEELLLADLAHCNCIVSESSIKGAGDGLWSLKDFVIGEVICSSYWGHLLVWNGDEIPSKDSCFGNSERLLKIQLTKPLRLSSTDGERQHADMFIIGSKSSAATYINSVQPKSEWFGAEYCKGKFKTQVDHMKKLRVGPFFKDKSLGKCSAVNCVFEEIRSRKFSADKGSFDSFASFHKWLTMPIQVTALRDIRAGEELFADYPF
jgi:ribosomal protein S16